MSTPKLSPEMAKALEAAKDAGGKLRRFPGGFWYPSDKAQGEWFGTTTVEALVKRGAMTYSRWQQRHWPNLKPFPIEATVRGMAK